MEHISYSGKLEKQKKFFVQGHTIPLNKRISALDKLSSCIKDHEPQLLDALRIDLGKPDIEAFLAEIYFVHQEIELIKRKLKSWLKPQKAGTPFYFWPAKSWIQREPYGTVLIFSPWNYPVQLSLSPLIAAIAAGNTVCIKPSEITSKTEQCLSSIIREAFPTEWVECITGGPEVSTELLQLDFDFVFFTGSTEVGRKVDASLAGRLIPKVLELGGKCPCIVNDSTSIDTASARILNGKFFNAGQTCFAPDFVAVHITLFPLLLTSLKTQLKLRFPDSNLRDLAHTPSLKHAQRLIDMRDEQAVVIGKDEGKKVAPTLQPVSIDSPLLRNEIFGPILPIVSYQNEDELWQILNSLSSPLALYLFSNQQDFTERIIQKFQSGSVCINDTMKQSSNLNLPFGGIGESGLGRYRGKWGIEQLSYCRSFTKRFMIRDLFETIPPYGEALDKMKKMLRWK